MDELTEVLRLKRAGGCLRDLEGAHGHHRDMLSAVKNVEVDALVDVTDAQTYNLLYKALEQTHVVTSNKAPIADPSLSEYKSLVSKAEDERRILDIGTTAGAGLRVPDMVERLGYDGFDRVRGCLSGTMNYLSQRVNEGRPLSIALREAMSPPREYAEPDPRLDLGGEDFARKLVIIGRICGSDIERDRVNVEDLIPEELKGVPLEDFMSRLDGLDREIQGRVEAANQNGMALWYLGTADFERDTFKVGFKSVPMDDMIARSQESDNFVRFHPKGWRRPVTVMGPGAGPQETVTGLLVGLDRLT
jgi:homoserine dehydrogenase